MQRDNCVSNSVYCPCISNSECSTAELLGDQCGGWGGPLLLKACSNLLFIFGPTRPLRADREEAMFKGVLRLSRVKRTTPVGFLLALVVV